MKTDREILFRNFDLEDYVQEDPDCWVADEFEELMELSVDELAAIAGEMKFTINKHQEKQGIVQHILKFKELNGMI